MKRVAPGPRAAKHPWRRVLAFTIDQLVVGGWIGVLTLAAWAMRRAGWIGEASPVTLATKVAGHATGLLLLTGPVLLAFAWLESRAGATVGKRALGLAVVAVENGRLPLRRALLRNALKLAPWELSHASIWYVPGRPFFDPPAPWNLAGWLVALAVAAVWVVGLFLGDGRTAYDRAARASVAVE